MHICWLFCTQVVFPSILTMEALGLCLVRLILSDPTIASWPN